MKFLHYSFAGLLALAPAALAQAPIPVVTEPSRVVLMQDPPTLVFYNSASGVGRTTYPQNTWVEIDVTRCTVTGDPCVPVNATGIFLSSILIITQGGDPYITDVTASVKSPDSSQSCWNYLGQTVEASPEGGQRSPWFAATPVVAGKIRFCRNTLRLGSFYEPPQGGPLAFGINMRMIGYLVP